MSKYSKEEQQQKNQFRDFLIDRKIFGEFCRELDVRSGRKFGEYVRSEFTTRGTLKYSIGHAFRWQASDRGFDFWDRTDDTWMSHHQNN
jgi:hypothetical protein